MAKNFKVTQDLLAPTWQRILHNVVDYLFVYFVILSIPALAVYFVIPPSQLGKLLPEIPVDQQLRQMVIYASGILIYENGMEIFFSRTIGKFITGTIVVTEDGSKPDTNTILTRSICRLIPLDNLSFFFRQRGWHDSISNTYVVNIVALENAKRAFYNEDISAE